MKKISGLIVLIFIFFSSFSERKMSPLIMNFVKEVDSGTTFYFLLTQDNANVLGKISIALGTPASNTSGRMTWNHVSIDGVGSDLTIFITDGLFTTDSVTHSACYRPFNNAEEKETFLRLIRPGQTRESRIEIKDKAGNHILSDGKAELKAQEFFDQKLD